MWAAYRHAAYRRRGSTDVRADGVQMLRHSDVSAENRCVGGNGYEIVVDRTDAQSEFDEIECG